MTTTAINATSTIPATATNTSATLAGYASLGEKDFLTMLTTELQQQDPTAPVDNKEMIAQMAQFSALAGVNTTNTTLTGIAAKLDTLIAARQAAQSTTGGAGTIAGA